MALPSSGRWCAGLTAGRGRRKAHVQELRQGQHAQGQTEERRCRRPRLRRKDEQYSRAEERLEWDADECARCELAGIVGSKQHHQDQQAGQGVGYTHPTGRADDPLRDRKHHGKSCRRRRSGFKIRRLPALESSLQRRNPSPAERRWGLYESPRVKFSGNGFSEATETMRGSEPVLDKVGRSCSREPW